jgi:hypothetical protein
MFYRSRPKPAKREIVEGSRPFKTYRWRQQRGGESCTVSVPRAKAAPLQHLQPATRVQFQQGTFVFWSNIALSLLKQKHANEEAWQVIRLPSGA